MIRERHVNKRTDNNQFKNVRFASNLHVCFLFNITKLDLLLFQIDFC